MALRTNFKSALAAVIMLLVSGSFISPASHAQTATLSTLYSFGSYDSNAQNTGGYSPVGLIGGPGGVLYGATESGGANGNGTLFNVHSDGTGFTVLHTFGSTDGSAGSLVLGAGSRLFGTEPNGGSNSSGAIFSMAADGTSFTALYSFSATDDQGDNPDGVSPTGALVQGSGGILYGETQFGGPNGEGNVYKIKADGTGFTVLHSFGGTATDGQYPAGGLIAGPDGTLYGVTEFGGANASGTVFKMNPDGSGYTALHQFSDDSDQLVNADGATPTATLTFGNDGLLYGFTVVGGTGGTGVVFRVATDGTGFKALHAFTQTDSQNANTDGAFPNVALVKDVSGNFYGATVSGGDSGLGTIFRLSADGSQFSAPYALQYGDGTNPALAEGSDGQVYGTTTDGGDNAAGSMFRIDQDNTTHVLWTNTNGSVSLWNYSTADGSFTQNTYGPYTGWTAAGVSDGPDGQTRVLWDNANGQMSVWSLNNATGAFTQNTYGPYAGWTAKAISVSANNTTHVLWTNTNGSVSLWNYSTADGSFTQNTYGPYTGWTAAGVSDGPDGQTRVLWDNANGQMSVWSLNNATGAFTQNTYGPYAGWTAKAISVSANNTTHVLWTNTNGSVSLWNYSTADGSFTQNTYGPYTGWTAAGVSDGPDGQTRVLWDNANGQMSLWSLNNVTGVYSQNSYGAYAGWTAKAISAP